ncbi:MAG: SDR family oxidoreductase [Alphaproteobacteria bacterium]|nr:SDR family oxidoreductase [Alphaproteobacteria bacterium]
MDLGLTGTRALVWGGSKGLARACAAALAAEGVAVTIAARTRATLEATAADLNLAWVEADLTTVEGRAAALAACPAPDILVNNAEGPKPGDFRTWQRADWHHALDAMMLGPIEMIRLVLDGMMERRFGRIINIVSRSVKAPQAELGLSNGSRAGLVGFVAGLARQTVSRGVTINNLLPGPFATDAQRDHVEGLAARTGRPAAEIWAERTAANPAGRFGEPAELGAWCAFLCARQSGFVTGQNILIDGGDYRGTF